jgi:hypothetical protein
MARTDIRAVTCRFTLAETPRFYGTNDRRSRLQRREARSASSSKYFDTSRRDRAREARDMDRFAEYRKRAKEMRARAKAAETESERIKWLELAMAWAKLADSGDVSMWSDNPEPPKP